LSNRLQGPELRECGTDSLKTAHILEKLLERGYSVVTTVRSEDKAQKIREAHKDLGEDKLKVVIVPDIAKEGAFDEVVKEPGLDVVLHTASPFHFNWSRLAHALDVS
jgi:nucleoside-diphosphate-sugar epimerase